MILHPALIQLMKLQGRGLVRRFARGAKTPKGAAFVVIGVVVLGGGLFGSTITGVVTSRTDPQRVRLVMPLILIGACVGAVVGNAGDKAISFTPAEVNFLFPGPFTRRELMLYKLGKAAFGALVASLLLSFAVLQHAGSGPASFLGVLLSMLFVQLFSTCAVLTAQTAGERSGAVWRKAALAALVLAAAVALVPAVRAGLQGGWVEAGLALERSPAARALLWPFRVYANVLVARSVLPQLLGWAAVAGAIDLALLALALRLDANYTEAAFAASARQYERTRRLESGNVLPPAGSRAARLRLPVARPPWAGGAGPIAWRQLTTALRTARGMLLIVALIGLCAAPVLFAAGVRNPTVIVIQFVSWVTLFGGSMMRFDFRGDLDQMPWLKSLPLSPTATAAGQLVAPVLILTAFHTAIFALAAAYSPTGRTALLLAIGFAPAFNVLMFAVENATFLLFPIRLVATTPGDVNAIGRQIVYFLLKALVLGIAGGVSAGFGFAAYALTGRSVAAGVAVAWAVLAAIAVVSVPCVGWTYSRFDPSRDTPA